MPRIKLGLYRRRDCPRVLVEAIGFGYFRAAEIKWPTVVYRDKKGNLDSRAEREFAMLFELVPES